MESNENIVSLIKLYSENQDLLISGNLALGEFVLSMSVALLISAFVSLVYKLKHQGIFFQSSFQLSIISAALITNIVIYTIGGNLILSLGLVGALSIVRFRTAVKDAQDIIYIYWAIAIGMSCATQNYTIAIIGSLILATVIYIYNRLAGRSSNSKYLLTVTGKSNELIGIEELLFENAQEVEKKFEIGGDGKRELSFEISVRTEKVLREFLDTKVELSYSLYPIHNRFGSVE